MKQSIDSTYLLILVYNITAAVRLIGSFVYIGRPGAGGGRPGAAGGRLWAAGGRLGGDRRRPGWPGVAAGGRGPARERKVWFRVHETILWDTAADPGNPPDPT